MELILRMTVIFGCGFLLVLGLGQLAVRTKTMRHYAFAALYISLALLELANANVNDDLSYYFPHLALIDLPFLFLTGPMLHLILKETVPQGDSVQRSAVLHLILPAAIFIATVPVYVMPAAEKTTRIAQTFSGQATYIHDYVYFAGLLITLIYVVYILTYLRRAITVETAREETSIQHIIFIILFSIMVLILAFVAVSTREYLWLRLGAAIICTGIAIIFILGHRYTDLYRSFVTVVQQSRTPQSHLEGQNIDGLKNRLEELMKQQKLYQDEELTLSSLAQQMDISLHQLSQLLNRHYEKNFSHFVTEYRIDAAKKLLTSDRDRTIISVAYEVGFNSISSFNRGFKKITGLTPKEYRQGRS